MEIESGTTVVSLAPRGPKGKRENVPNFPCENEVEHAGSLRTASVHEPDSVFYARQKTADGCRTPGRWRGVRVFDA